MNVKGCVLSPVDLRDYRLKISRIYSTTYPDNYEISMIHNIKSQGKVNSCVAMSTSSILEYYDKSSNDKLSTNFIYGGQNTVYGFPGPGMFLRCACAIAYKYGDPKYTLCPGNTEVPDVFKESDKAFKNEEVLKDAYKHKIKSYANLFRSKKAIKYSLMNHGPVLAVMRWYDKYTVDKDTGIITFDKSSSSDYHAFVIYGWDKDYWLCQNSWGTKFGKNGLFKLSFKDGPHEAFCLVDDDSLSSKSDIVNPTHDVDLIEIVLKLVNKIISIFTKR